MKILVVHDFNTKEIDLGYEFYDKHLDVWEIKECESNHNIGVHKLVLQKKGQEKYVTLNLTSNISKDIIINAINDTYGNKHEKFINDLRAKIREGSFEDSLEEIKKNGESKNNRYNDGLYDMINKIEKWILDEVEERKL